MRCAARTTVSTVRMSAAQLSRSRACCTLTASARPSCPTARCTCAPAARRRPRGARGALQGRPQRRGRAAPQAGRRARGERGLPRREAPSRRAARLRKGRRGDRRLLHRREQRARRRAQVRLNRVRDLAERRHRAARQHRPPHRLHILLWQQVVLRAARPSPSGARPGDEQPGRQGRAGRTNSGLPGGARRAVLTAQLWR